MPSNLTPASGAFRQIFSILFLRNFAFMSGDLMITWFLILFLKT